MKLAAFAALVVTTMFCASVSADDRFGKPGELEPSSGAGVKDDTILYPAMRFPLESAPAYLNSQVYRKGGSHPPSPGGQCDA